MSTDNTDDAVDIGNLDLFEGDVSLIIRGDGQLEFLIACENEESEEYLSALNLVHYLKFVLETPACRELFDHHMKKSTHLN